MMHMQLRARQSLAVFALVASFACGLACSPRDAAPAFSPAVVSPITQAACILLRAVAPSGTLDEVCATAEELAPFVSEILQARVGAGKVSEATAPIVAFSFPAPALRVPRRRCVSWVPVAEARARAPDAAAEAGGDAGDVRP